VDQRKLFDLAYGAFASLLLGSWDAVAAPKPWLSGLHLPDVSDTLSVSWMPNRQADRYRVSERTVLTRSGQASAQELHAPAHGMVCAADGAWRRSLAAMPLPRRRGYRRISGHHGPYWDMARTLKQQREHPEMVTLWHRHRRIRVRPTWFLWDASRSMEGFISTYFQFFHALAGMSAAVDVFAFSTRLAHITPLLQIKGEEQSYQSIFANAPYLRGGTLLSEALETFTRQLRQKGGSRTNVVVVTDGYDAGSPEDLSNSLLKVKRSCHRLFWWNPWGKAPGYAPVTLSAKILKKRVNQIEPAGSLEDCIQAWKHLR
jgi:uncharacterized protein with von Willebrand factor type A (vWA) domain